MDPLLWLLLPVAAASGWWAARRGPRRASRQDLHPDYFLGLNHLLNEEADKATEVLVRLVEVDPDTVELHLALGSLFRRRGEVDRAIRVHENVIARSSLSEQRRAQAMLELGRDYARAGLFDRAEELFQGLLARGRYMDTVAAHLTELYQQEKEWLKAIELSEAVRGLNGDTGLRVAHYWCELAEEAMRQGDTASVPERLERAQQSDPASVRVAVLRGRYHQQRGEYAQALDCYLGIESKDPLLLPPVFDAIAGCYRALDREQDAAAWFRALATRQPALLPLIPFHWREDDVAATAQRGEDAEPVASPADLLLDVRRRRRAGAGPEDLAARLESGLQRLVASQPNYRCGDCGFSSRTLFWQCPGCQRWSSMRPVAWQQENA